MNMGLEFVAIKWCMGSIRATCIFESANSRFLSARQTRVLSWIFLEKLFDFVGVNMGLEFV